MVELQIDHDVERANRRRLASPRQDVEDHLVAGGTRLQRFAPSTASSPSVSTAASTRTNRRSASSPVPSLRRSRASAGGRFQPWSGAPLRTGELPRGLDPPRFQCSPLG